MDQRRGYVVSVKHFDELIALGRKPNLNPKLRRSTGILQLSDTDVAQLKSTNKLNKPLILTPFKSSKSSKNRVRSDCEPMITFNRAMARLTTNSKKPISNDEQMKLVKAARSCPCRKPTSIAEEKNIRAQFFMLFLTHNRMTEIMEQIKSGQTEDKTNQEETNAEEAS